MLKLVLKIALALIVVLAVVLGVRNFLAIEGLSTISFAGREVSLDTSRLLLIVAAGFAALYLALEILRRGLGSVFAVGGWMKRRRRRRGVDAVSRALVALAEGDGAKALREAEKAEGLIEEPRLTRIISAQAARLAGDDRKSEQAYEQMTETRETEFLGVMGMLRQALVEKKQERALRLAERAHALRPKKGEVIDILFDLQRRKGDFVGARRTLSSSAAIGRLTRDVAERRRAVLHVAEAMQKEAAGEADAALSQATEATRIAPALTPAAVMAARLLAAKGEERSAARTLVNAWRIAPHPELAETFAALAPNEDADERLRRFEKLLTAKPDATEARLLKAELALAAEKVDVARDALGDLADSAPSARACALMAAIEQSEGSDEAIVRAWLSRAASAPRAPKWVCANCGSAAAHWSHTCASCDAFDQMVWKRVEGEDSPLDHAITALLARVRTEPALPAPEQGGAAAIGRLTGKPLAQPRYQPDPTDPAAGRAQAVAAARAAAIAAAAGGRALVRVEDDHPGANGATNGSGHNADHPLDDARRISTSREIVPRPN